MNQNFSNEYISKYSAYVFSFFLPFKNVLFCYHGHPYMSLTLLHVGPHDHQLSHELNYYKLKVLMYLFLK